MWEHIKQVYANSRATGAAHQVLVYLAYRANDNDVAWPSHSTIARDCNMSRRSVVRALAQLGELGEIEIIDTGNGKSNRYRLTCDNLSQVAATEGVTDCHTGCDTLSQGGVTICPKPVTDCHTNRKNGHLNSQRKEKEIPPLVSGTRYETPDPPTPPDELDPLSPEFERLQNMITALSAVVRETKVIGENDDRFTRVAKGLIDAGYVPGDVHVFGTMWEEGQGSYDGRPYLKSVMNRISMVKDKPDPRLESASAYGDLDYGSL